MLSCPVCGQLSHELLLSPSSHHDIPDPGVSFNYFCLSQKATFPLPVARDTERFPQTHWKRNLLTGFKPGNPALLLVLVHLTSTTATCGGRNKKRHQKVRKQSSHQTRRKRSSSSACKDPLHGNTPSHLGIWAQVPAQRACKARQKGQTPLGCIRENICHPS